MLFYVEENAYILIKKALHDKMGIYQLLKNSSKLLIKGGLER